MKKHYFYHEGKKWRFFPYFYREIVFYLAKHEHYAFPQIFTVGGAS